MYLSLLFMPSEKGNMENYLFVKYPWLAGTIILNEIDKFSEREIFFSQFINHKKACIDMFIFIYQIYYNICPVEKSIENILLIIFLHVL